MTIMNRENPFDSMGPILKSNSLSEILKGSQTDWVVEKHSATAIIDSLPGQVPVLAEPNPGVFVLTRNDTNAIIGSVGNRYSIIQNEDHANLVETIAGLNSNSVYNGWVLNNGAVVGFTIKLDDISVGAENLDVYFHIVNRHDGKGSLRGVINSLRNECTNVLSTGSTEFSIRHTISAKDRVIEAREALQDAVDCYSSLQEDLSWMLQLDMKDIVDVYSYIWPCPMLKGKALSQWESRLEEITEVWKTSPNLNNVRYTAYGVFNAITEWAQWNRNFQGSKGNSEVQRLTRGREIIFGRSKEISNKAFKAIVEIYG